MLACMCVREGKLVCVSVCLFVCLCTVYVYICACVLVICVLLVVAYCWWYLRIHRTHAEQLTRLDQLPLSDLPLSFVVSIGEAQHLD